MNPIVQEITQDQLRDDIPDFKAGDRLRVMVKIVEGDKERTQPFVGDCIGRKGSGINETFTVRRISYGVGMERVFPLHSPRIAEIKVMRKGKVRRSKLYYMRGRSGKAAKIREEMNIRIEPSQKNNTDENSVSETEA